jgi:hypothetical protein
MTRMGNNILAESETNVRELPPWRANPYRLISLYEIANLLTMEKFEAVTFYNVGKLLESVASLHGTNWLVGSGFTIETILNDETTQEISADKVPGMKALIAAIGEKCNSIQLERSAKYAAHIIERLGNTKRPTYFEFGSAIRELDKHIRWDMEAEMFMYVPKSSSGFYGLDLPLGQEVNNAFPAARFDLQQAGNCLAFGAYTASGLHLMRAAEVALWELGRDRQIPLAQSDKIEFAEWGNIIGELEKAVIAIQQWPNSARKEDAHRFYNRALVEIRSFNDGIRRHLAHVRTKQVPIEEDEALANWGHISRFMKTLSSKIGTGKYTPLEWT